MDKKAGFALIENLKKDKTTLMKIKPMKRNMILEEYVSYPIGI